MAKSYDALRREYTHARLDRSDIDLDPIVQFHRWFDEAIEHELPLANAMTLSTVDAQNRPSSRVVLLKDVSSAGFVFFTNYESRKGHELRLNRNAALLFWWPPMERQVRIEGECTPVEAQVSDEYFSSRPEGSNLSAIASRQSQVIENREVLEARVAELAAHGGPHPRPAYWGGYCLAPRYFEFWQGRTDRLHDRFSYLRKIPSGWQLDRLSP